MAFLGTRNTPTRPSTKKNPPRNRPELDTPVLITDVDKATNVMTLTFDVPVRVGVQPPAFTTDLPGVTVSSMQQTGPNVVALTFSGAITTATELIIPYRDPAIRGQTGGYVTSNTFPV